MSEITLTLKETIQNDNVDQVR